MFDPTPQGHAKLMAFKRAATEYLASCAPDDLGEAERLLCIEIANCADDVRRKAAVQYTASDTINGCRQAPPDDGAARRETRES